MFENYSFGDLLSNVYKKRILNIILFLLISISVVSPLIIKTINRKTVVKEGVQYSTFLTYKITAPKELDLNTWYSRRGYSDYYYRLLEYNLNGAFIFNDVDDKTMNQMARELDTSAVTLKNSNKDYWDKKIEVTYISTNLGVSVKILTPSKLVNDEIEKKFDGLIEKYKDVYEDVKVEKYPSNYSKELESKENINNSYSLKKLIAKSMIIEIMIAIAIFILNFIAYIFNPTINREGDYKKYNISFVQEIINNDELNSIVKFLKEKHNLSNINMVSSNPKLLKKVKINNENIQIINKNDIANLINSNNIIFIEEYGITRYSKFEKTLQKLNNLDKNVLGVLSFKL